MRKFFRCAGFRILYKEFSYKIFPYNGFSYKKIILHSVLVAQPLGFW